MKKSILTLSACLFLACGLTSCQKDDDAMQDIEKEQVTETPEMENLAPSTAILTEPLDNSELQSLSPLLQWTEAIDQDGDALKYKVMLGTTEHSFLPVATDINSLEYQLETPLEKGVDYYWKVVATDAEGNESTSDIFTFKTEYISINLLLAEADFSKRKSATTTVFNNKIWVIGGQDQSGNVLEDIWSSTDGLNWTLELANAPFGKRRDHYTIVFKDKMWVYSGSNGTSLNADIWSTSDGINWIKETNDSAWDTLPFYGQSHTTMFIHEDKIWRLAAYDGAIGDLTTERYIWNSSDGKNWNLVSENHGFDSKYGMAVVSFQGRLIGLEGVNIGTNKYTKIWESIDGVNWTLIDESLPFELGFYTDAVVNQNRLYITGGSQYDELWYTDDGINWNKAIEDRGFSIRWAKSSIVLNDKIYIIGGGFNSNYYNDVWELE